MIRSLFLAFSFLCLALLPARSGETVRVVADEWPPFSGTELPGRGISVDVITQVLTRAGYDVKSDILPWARIMAEAKSDSFDVVGSLFYDADIATYMNYGEPFYQTEVKFLRRAGADHQVNGFEDLQQYSIAVGDGFLYAPAFDRAEDLNKIVVPTALQGIQMVAFDRADLTLDSVEVLQHSIADEGPDLAERVELLPFVLATHGIHMAVRKSHPQGQAIVADFNRVLNEMKADGSLARVLSKHIQN